MNRLRGLHAKQKPRRIRSIYSLREHNRDLGQSLDEPPHLANTLSCPAWNFQQRGAGSETQDEETRGNGKEEKEGFLWNAVTPPQPREPFNMNLYRMLLATSTVWFSINLKLRVTPHSENS